MSREKIIIQRNVSILAIRLEGVMNFFWSGLLIGMTAPLWLCGCAEERWVVRS